MAIKKRGRPRYLEAALKAPPLCDGREGTGESHYPTPAERGRGRVIILHLQRGDGGESFEQRKLAHHHLSTGLKAHHVHAAGQTGSAEGHLVATGAVLRVE